MDQWVAGYPVSRRRYWEYLPADLRLLVYSLGHEDSLVPLLFKIKSRLQVDSYVILVVAK